MDIIDIIYDGHSDLLSSMIKNGASVYECEGYHLLNTAVKARSYPIIELLLSHGADINLPATVFGATPLTQACALMDLGMVIFLIERGAVVDSLTNNGVWTALVEASTGKESKRLDIVKLLIAHGANANRVFYSREGIAVASVLSYACDSTSIEVARVLIEHGAEIEPDLFLGTPLQRATKNNNVEIVELLIKNGADPMRSFKVDPRLLSDSGQSSFAIGVRSKNARIRSLYKRISSDQV